MMRAMDRVLLVALLAVASPADRAAAAGLDAWGRMTAAQASGESTRATDAGTGRGVAADTDRYGSLATGMPYDYEIRVGPDTRWIAVWRLQTIRFLAADGSEFRWRFDGPRALDEFPLAAIAPPGFAVPAGARVSLNGEIPISP
jgi:hypothetical protein